jgi:Fic family protein
LTNYIWQNKEWPNFTWDDKVLLKQISHCRFLQGKLLAKISSMGFQYEQQAQVDILFEEAITTSAIEGETLNRDSVKSSIARKLGLPDAGFLVDRHTDGLIDVLLDATQKHKSSLTKDRLFGWHAALFPAGYSGMHKIKVGKWRDEQMQVISGRYGKETIHYEAIPADQVDEAMTVFIDWWKNSCDHLDGLLRAAITHFWFVGIHPFDDGNGRIARALTDMALAQDDNQSMRYYSMSSQINADRKNYYDILENSQKGTVDITSWISWFLDCFARSIERSEGLITLILEKSSFWYKHTQLELNDRNKKVINKLLDAGKNGFEGGMTNKKYASITGISRATATRELQYLVEINILKQNDGKGRSVSYDIVWE